MYYADESTFRDLVELAYKYNLSFTRNIDQLVVIFFVESEDTLINLARDIKLMFE